MLKECLFCGASFEGSAQARFCSDAHRKAHARTRTDVRVGEVGQSENGEVGQRHPVDLGWGTVTRFAVDGTPVEEPLGPAGLSLVAFPVQVEGDLAPSPELLRKLRG